MATLKFCSRRILVRPWTWGQHGGRSLDLPLSTGTSSFLASMKKSSQEYLRCLYLLNLGKILDILILLDFVRELMVYLEVINLLFKRCHVHTVATEVLVTNAAL